MTGIERTLAALRFEETDRVPIAGGFVRHPEFLAECAGVSVEEFWKAPRSTAVKAFTKLGVDTVIGMILPDRQSSTGAQVSHVQQTRYDSPEQVRDYIENEYTPPPADEETAYNRYLEEYSGMQKELGSILWIPNMFRLVPAYQLEGMFGAENYYMALLLYPETMKKIFQGDAERAYAESAGAARAIMEKGLPKVIWTGQDTCDNRGPYISPDVMNDIYFPYVRKALSPLKEAGAKIIWHSDGNIFPVVPHLLECGVDGFQGLQEEVGIPVDVDALADCTTLEGKKTIIVGSVSSTGTMPFGTPGDIREKIERYRSLAMKRGGGLLLNFSSSLGPEVPIENIRTFFRVCRKDVYSPIRA